MMKLLVRLTFGVVSIIIFCLTLFEHSMTVPKPHRFINVSSTTTSRELNMVVNSTNSTAPPVTVALYYLPLNELNVSRHPPLKELAFGTKDSFGYPIGALLLSTPSEYAIPFDRTPIQRHDRAFKYFREMRGHYHMDARYGRHTHARLSNSDLMIIIRGLFAAWSNFTDEKQIPSWIAHGTLLGWWWGGSFLPWDTDIDVQMNANSLYNLAIFNNTVLSNRYLIDVNPHFKARFPQVHNVIDARLIDKYSGYFIDITGVADVGTSIASDPQKLLLCDKHIHKYSYSDLHPLVRTEIQGIPTWRPYQTEKCLTKEYGPQALVKTRYRDHKYDVANAVWIKYRMLPKIHR